MSESVFDYFLNGREPARKLHETDVPEFTDNHSLLKELRVVFDWIGGQKNCMKIPSRLFKKRLPEVHSKFPQLANNFYAMDVNSDCWLEWHEFTDFCLKNERLVASLKRETKLQVYGIDHDGTRMYKASFDPAHSCEVSSSPDMLPWEVAHVVEWRIPGLKYAVTGPRQGSFFWGRRMLPSQFLASQPFRAAGVCGFLRFWPVNYYNEAQLRKKKDVASVAEQLEELQGGAKNLIRMPPAEAWCCIGAVLPPGTNLDFRFYIGSSKSPKRECFWNQSVNPASLWTPKGAKPPQHVIDMTEEDYLTVGIEIFWNRNDPFRKHQPDVLRKADRLKQRPEIKNLGYAKPCDSFILNRSASVPAPSGQETASRRKLIREKPKPAPRNYADGTTSSFLPELPRRAASETDLKNVTGEQTNFNTTMRTTVSDAKPLRLSFSLPTL
mmetsp:Transcript_42394/g.76100  ORF Transcript_42394/g.76100 Transcript_42394/m.76100 type:complete len:439 (+) Transcript_42394:66-1382(+)|eukprot:CAMPEP_0197635484 /NCGR_PEP_ID=MMETSP1338-20131121/11290_1 /TAXON_ID=43686 ORGANISM="Pelagodinium beii, Strain RCC1491" /NCGR_SAMPLE_ID=MMETSP1338 /ASSEMBLY_ACC=CAM_ASM_000754 /LENGTH=438 /DNA_ID=CAMNT_0043207545 /DNA_START=66 /DNA_END=1382 /DNA_ORIENTATION=-